MKSKICVKVNKLNGNVATDLLAMGVINKLKIRNVCSQEKRDIWYVEAEKTGNHVIWNVL